MSKGVDIMERSRYRNNRFSLKYRIEKWFYEDSLNHLILVLKGIGMMATLLAGFALISIGPALFI